MIKIKIQGDGQNRNILINGHYLDPIDSQKVYNHSPDGFNWGYCGSGPAQLALAIMLLYLGPRQAGIVYQDFKNEVIAKLPQGKDFEIEVDIEKWINKGKDAI